MTVKSLRKAVALLISFVFMFQHAFSAAALTDEFIFTDPIKNIYTGRREAIDMIRLLDFADLPIGHPMREDVVRAGALNMVKPYGSEFRPDVSVSNEDVLEFIIRALGQENQAQQSAAVIRAAQPPDSSLLTLWSLGYLDVAMQRGLITKEQYADALSNQELLDPAFNFMREGECIRENAADWLYRGLRSTFTTMFDSSEVQHSIYNFPDWSLMSVDKVAAVEALTANGIMTATEDGLFEPKAPLTRGDLVQMLINLDEFYYTASGMLKKTGTVGGIKDSQSNTTNAAALGRDIYIRASDGTIDVLRYNNAESSSPRPEERDAVVYKEGEVVGMGSLAEGDEIEYLVNAVSSQVMYVEVLNSVPNIYYVEGILRAVDIAGKTITLEDADGKEFKYPMVDGLIGNDGQIEYIYVDMVRRNVRELPIGSKMQIRLLNDIVDEVKYIGEQYVISEAWGIVIENNPDFGYLVYVDNIGNVVTKNYNARDMRVDKQQHYETDTGAGYLSYLFPNFEYNPRESSISEIEPGDVIYLRFDPNDQNIILNISASTNYMMRYGKIVTFRDNGQTISLAIEYENKQSAVFTVPSGIFISKGGSPISAASVKVGDWVKLLINQAIITGGHVVETVKEMTIESDEHLISKIVRGKLSSINNIQNQLVVSKAYTLDKVGWGFAKDIEQFSIRNRDIEYYYNENQISLDYASQYLKNSACDVYIALENGFGGESVRMVTFRDDYDRLLGADSVADADGNGSFTLGGSSQTYSTDNGTIVRRYGRLVSGKDILAPDYAVVSLNGVSLAAVVDITDAPDVSGFTVIRGRIMTVNDGATFKVQSMSMLTGNSWPYTPIAREFMLDADTLYLNQNGYVPLDQFISYGAGSVFGRSFNIIALGGRALRIAETPFSSRFVRGTIYEITPNGLNYTVMIRDAHYYDAGGGGWRPVNTQNPAGGTIAVNLRPDSLIGRNNEAVNPGSLVNGDLIKIMTNVIPAISPTGMQIDGHIVLVER